MNNILHIRIIHNYCRKKDKEHINGSKLSIAVIDLYRADKAITSNDSLPCYEIVILCLNILSMANQGDQE